MMMQGQNDAALEAQYLQMEQHILKMGNEILAALNADDVVTDIQIFQMDVFYIQIFQEVFGQELGLTPGQTPEQMAENIDALLNMIEDSLPEINIETLNGDMIVEGDPSQILMMLELIYELVRMIDPEEEEEEEENDLNKKLEQQLEQELKKKQDELIAENNSNTMQGRGEPGAQAARVDPREMIKQRKLARLQQEEQKAQPSNTVSPDIVEEEQSKNPLDQFAARNKNKPKKNDFGAAAQQNPLANQPQLNQFGNQPQLNQFGNQPQLNQFGNQPQLQQFGNQPQLSQFQGGNPQLKQFNGAASPGGGGFAPFGAASGGGLAPFGGAGTAPFGSAGGPPFGGAGGPPFGAVNQDPAFGSGTSPYGKFNETIYLTLYRL